ncbi:MAG: hypothetical protein J6A59_08130, partial [Lachnospiraceae bacterium]|nr:hypothetical protein [Lachnospiraceae bacterium]
MKKIGIGLILTVIAITCMACGNKDDSDDKEVNYIEVSDSIHDYRSDYEYKLEEIQEYLDEESYETAIDELNLLKDIPEFQEFTDDIDLRISDIKKLMLNESIKTINDEYELDKTEEGIGQAAFDQIIRLDNLKEDYNEFTVDIENNIEHAIKNNYNIIMESADKAINENLKGNLESTDYFIDSAIPLLEDAIEQVNISGKYNKYTKLIKD